jgi:hypothetical protein
VERTPRVTRSSSTASSPARQTRNAPKLAQELPLTPSRAAGRAMTGAAKGSPKQEAKRSLGQGPRERSYLSQAAQAWGAAESTPSSPFKKHKRDNQTGGDAGYKLRERKDGR